MNILTGHRTNIFDVGATFNLIYDLLGNATKRMASHSLKHILRVTKK